MRRDFLGEGKNDTNKRMQQNNLVSITNVIINNKKKATKYIMFNQNVGHPFQPINT
jgi:hypothetical protein